MAPPQKFLDNFRRTRGIWVVALIVIALVTAVGLIDRWLAYQEIDRIERRNLTTQVGLVGNRIGDHIRDIDTTLDEVIGKALSEGHCDPRLHERYAKRYPEFGSINLFDAQGVIRCASRAELVGRPSAIADTIRARPQDGMLVIHKPMVGILKQPVILFTRAKTDAAGMLHLAATVAINLAWYDTLLDSLRDKDQGILLAHDSGLLLSRLPDPETYRLRDVSRGNSAFSIHRASGQSLTITRTVVATDQAERYVAMINVAPAQLQQQPSGRLSVAVSDRVDKVFHYWWQQNLMFLGVWWIVVLAILAMAFQVARRQLQLEDESDKRKRTTDYLITTSHELAQQQYALDEHAIVSVADRAGNIVSVNDKFCAISGYTRAELIGANHRILNSGTRPPEFFRDMWRTIAGGKPWHGLICNRAKDGRFYWVNSTIVPILDETGKIDRYVSIRTDVTALVNAQADLRKSESNFRSIYEHLQDVFYRTDLDGRVTMASPSVEAMLGYTPQELIGRQLAELWVEPANRADALQQMQEQGGALSSFVSALRHRNGDVVWVSTNAHFYRDDAGNIAGVEGMTHDITKRKRIEDALLAAKEAAEAANQAKSAFLSNMSHELRTPLNSILGFSQLLQGSRLAPDIREDVDRIHNAGSHLLKLINEVLDLAKVEAGKIEVDMQPVDAVALLNECHALERTQATQYGVTLDWQAPAEAIRVHADHGRLKQAVLNLLSNAIKYNRTGGTASIGIERHGAGRVRISVADTGIGLSKNQLQHLFTPFSRLGPKNIEGTGIGLTITRRIVELMGGTIGVDSTPEVGSTFWIELAAADATTSAAAPTAAVAALTGGGTTGTVLYIEDNPSNMQLMRSALGRLSNIHLLTATEPILGLELARDQRPDLILLDINLPGMDGFEVLTHLREDVATRSIPVVAVSANAMPGDITAGRNAGFDGYVTKPLNVNALLLTIERLLPLNG